MSQEQEKKYKHPSEFELTNTKTGETVSFQVLLDRHQQWVKGMPKSILKSLESGDRTSEMEDYFNKEGRFCLYKFNENDLSMVDLRNANLVGANLREAKLIKSNLKKANLLGAALNKADLSESNLIGANLTRAKLEDADLLKTKLINADLINANLEGADLSESNLRGANLFQAHLNRANLFQTKLRKTYLAKTDLSNVRLLGASLIQAVLTEANLFQVDLSKSNLRRANLSGAILSGANLSNTNLLRANLNDANLSQAILNEANLSQAILNEANLSQANLNDANLSEATLRKAILSKAHFERADLSKADLEGANLSGAILIDANLSRAILKSTNLSYANLKSATLSGAVINQKTIDDSKIIQKGGTAINGIFARNDEVEFDNVRFDEGRFDSAALLHFNPKADSKLGRSADVVVENLKHAQHLTGVYFTMVGVIFINLLVESGFMDGKKLSSLPIIGTFVNLDVPLLFGLSLVFVPIILFMIRQGLEKAYEGSKYLQTRDEIYKVGAFAWTLTQYVDPKDKDKNKNKSIIIRYKYLRGIMVFCAPAVLFLLLANNLCDEFKQSCRSSHIVFLLEISHLLILSLLFFMEKREIYMRIVLCILLIILMITIFSKNLLSNAFYFAVIYIIYLNCRTLFDIVEQFQKPLVFDAYKDSPEYIKQKEKEDLKKEVEKEIERENLRKSLEAGRE